ncbi:unnamed protein product [Cyprideis torosa]|uniref:Uncharacterized protein n=1 Tax=Cyprideis torosa TaxID=163714 RepID=A0A7R8WR08_9CRUS|nr:unnamed protein product [Cyprideis torosa]CAG0903282.1 unnamed protein product [Cyprideis torosa]
MSVEYPEPVHVLENPTMPPEIESKFSLCWSIEPLGVIVDPERPTRGKMFYSPAAKSTWALQFSPTGTGGILFLTLYHDSCSRAYEVNAEVKVYMWSYQTKPPMTTKYECTITGKFKRGCVVFQTTFSTIGRFYRNDYLRIQCDIIPFAECSTAPPPHLPCVSYLLEEGKKLFATGLHSDVTLVVKDRKFSAHKSILAAQSPVFASMFEHEMLEKQTGEVKITDIQAKVIEELLRFMYTGDAKNIRKLAEELTKCWRSKLAKVIEELLRFMYTGDAKNIRKLAEELFLAAVKYELKSLKKICEKQLAATLDRTSFHGILVLADADDSSFLKDALKEFVRHYPKVILDDENMLPETMENNSLFQQLYLEAKAACEAS